MAEKKREGCGTTRHCETWGFCHRCEPEMSERVLEAWNGGENGEEYREVAVRLGRKR